MRTYFGEFSIPRLLTREHTNQIKVILLALVPLTDCAPIPIPAAEESTVINPVGQVVGLLAEVIKSKGLTGAWELVAMFLVLFAGVRLILIADTEYK